MPSPKNTPRRSTSTDAKSASQRTSTGRTTRHDQAESDQAASPSSRPSQLPVDTDWPQRFVSADAQSDSADLVVQDSYWLRVCWKLSPKTLARAEKAFGRDWRNARPVVRLRGLNSGEVSGKEIESVCDVFVPGNANEWFLQSPPETFAEVEIGYRTLEPDGKFFALASSETVATRAQTAPTIAPTAVTPDGALPDDVLAELQRMRTGGERFSLQLDAELVLHGRTAAGANVGIGDDSIKADANGQFEYRRPLTSGRTVLPIEARSATGHESRSGVASTDFNLRVLEASGDE